MREGRKQLSYYFLLKTNQPTKKPLVLEALDSLLSDFQFTTCYSKNVFTVSFEKKSDMSHISSTNHKEYISE